MAKDRIEIEVLAKGVKDAQADIKKLQKEIDQTGKQTQKSGDSMIAKFGAIAAAAFTAFQTIKKGVNLAKEFALFEQSVKAMETQFGVSADKMIKKLDDVAKGTISNADLISAANRAMALNVTQDVDQMAQLLEVARVRGQSMGIDTTQAFNDIVTGIGRASPLILDNLGIITKGWAEEAKAAGGAFDAQFILNKVLADGAKILEKTGDVALTSAERFQKIDAQAANLKLAIGKELLPELERFFDLIDSTGGGEALMLIIRFTRVITFGLRSAITQWERMIQTIIAVKLGLQSLIPGGKEARDKLKKHVDNMGKDFKKLNKELKASWDRIFADIDTTVGDTSRKFKESNAANVESTKSTEKEILALKKQAVNAAKQLNNDFFNHAASLRQAELDDTIAKLEEEREARLNAAGTAAAQLAELDEQDKNARLATLQAEKDMANEIGNSELEAEKDREIKRIQLLEQQKLEEAAINKEFDEKIKAQKIEAAKADKKLKIAQALSNSALAITSTWAFTQGGVVTKSIAAGIAAAATAAQVALIAASPLPKFRQGTDFAPEGPAVVGEEGPEIVNLPQGASVTPTNEITNESFDNRTMNITVQPVNYVDFVNEMQSVYGVNAFEAG